MLTFWYINHKKIKGKECVHVTIICTSWLQTNYRYCMTENNNKICVLLLLFNLITKCELFLMFTKINYIFLCERINYCFTQVWCYNAHFQPYIDILLIYTQETLQFNFLLSKPWIKLFDLREINPWIRAMVDMAQPK